MDSANNSNYEQMLATVGANSSALTEDQLCLFRTKVGSRWGKQLLVCGRAVNGAEPVWPPSRALTSASRIELLAEIVRHDEKESCPMEWIALAWGRSKSYNTARSAFWRVTRAVADRLNLRGLDQADWSSYLAWANLYRIAPGITGNPNGQLMRLQLELCRAQLERDIAELNPECVLFLTGLNWAQGFLTELEVLTTTPGQLVERTGRLSAPNGRRISVVVAKHPQGKPHTRFVQAAVDAFAAVA
jgi:hypothetical protein